MPDPSVPESAYVHIPFCRHRCGYCNFALVAKRDYLIDRFLDALNLEFSRLPQRYVLKTLFLGGGTPTHLSLRQLERLFESLNRYFDYATAEVTSEANPNDLTLGKIQLLNGLGVNRFSLGVQSFDASKLKLLERDHSADQVRKTVSQLQEYTENISLDLIFATMGETQKSWQDDLDQAIKLQPKHLSTYELTIEKGTQFWKRTQIGKLIPVAEDLRAEMYQQTLCTLSQAGLEQYEISSFAKPGFQCQHNLVYWSGAPYLAFGAGASQYLNGIRQTNHQSVSTYLKRIEANESPYAFSESLSPLDRALELLIIGLRKIEGVFESDFQTRTDLNFEETLGDNQRKLIDFNLIEREQGRIRLTSKGVLLYDSVAEIILNRD